jgi:hypothetical protein
MAALMDTVTAVHWADSTADLAGLRVVSKAVTRAESTVAVRAACWVCQMVAV